MKKNPLIPKGFRKLRQNEIIRKNDLRVRKQGDSFITGNPGLRVNQTHAKKWGEMYVRKN